MYDCTLCDCADSRVCVRGRTKARIFPFICRQSAAKTFPYHRCSDYNASSLPYDLTKPVETSPGLYCMTLSFRGYPTNPSTCYNVLTTYGATRLIMGVSPACKADFNVKAGFFLNGKVVPDNVEWLTETGGSIIKAYNQNITPALAGATICYKSAQVVCPSMSQFFQAWPGPYYWPINWNVETDYPPICCPPPANPQCVEVTTQGSLETLTVCNSMSTPLALPVLANYIGYGSYTCSLNLTTFDTCGCSYSNAGTACQDFSPP
ncbi:hypothetical protein CEUSTIGMA_g2032.t1, partial [Chlamydomonas eustigma]